MSYAAQTKKELTMISDDACCRKAEVEAIISLNGTVRSLGDRSVLDVETENVATARRIYTQIKELYTIQPEVLVRKKMRLKKNNVYAVRVPGAQHESMLNDLGWASPVSPGALAPPAARKRKACCRRALLRGAFLAAGSVNDPGSSSYHLEIATSTQVQAEQLQTAMNSYGLHAKRIRRKKGFVVYLKEGEKIVEFLSLIGAHQALLRFEDVRILKGMRNQVNRLVNCETANMNKTIGAAVRQLEVIRLIDRRIGLNNLPIHLREVADLRIRYPEITLQELSELMTHRISKSGLNHRFRKLEEIAQQLREPSDNTHS